MYINIFLDVDPLESLKKGNVLFAKYIVVPEYMINSCYKMTKLPGGKEGLSATSVNGFSVGISDNISNERKIAALKALKFLSSKEMQRKYSKEHRVVTGILSLFDEDEICIGTGAECELFKSLQSIGINPFHVENIELFNEKFLRYINEYLNGNKGAKEVLQKAVDITKIYHLNLNGEESPWGLIFFIINCFLCTIILLSIIFLFINKFEQNFKLLSVDFWILFIIGTVFILSAYFTILGNITNIKCHLSLILISFGYIFNYIPILYKLIVNFPGESKYSIYIKKNKYFFLLFLISIMALFHFLLYNYQFDIEDIIVEDNHNFQKCTMNNIYGKILLYFTIIYIFLILIIILLYCFMEWNLEKMHYDIRKIVSIVYIDILSLTILLITNTIMTKTFNLYYLIRICILYIISISNYFLIYGLKILNIFFNKNNIRNPYKENSNKNEELTTTNFKYENRFSIWTNSIINNANDNNKNNNCNNNYNNNFNNNYNNDNYITTNNTSTNNTNSNNSSYINRGVSYSLGKNSFLSKMIDYHYTTS